MTAKKTKLTEEIGRSASQVALTGCAGPRLNDPTIVSVLAAAAQLQRTWSVLSGN